MVTEGELRAIRARLDAASPGPWKAWVEGRDHWGGDTFIQIGGAENRGPDLYLHFDWYDDGTWVANHDFIAHAREDIETLLGEIERLKDG